MATACARELRLRVPPEQVERAVTVLCDEIVEFYAKMTSYLGVTVYGDPDTGELASISLWANFGDQGWLSPHDVLSYARGLGIDMTIESVKIYEVLYQHAPSLSAQ